MLERCFKNPLTLHRLHTGPAGPFLDGLAESMCAERYSSETSGSYLQAADHLGQWAARRGARLHDYAEFRRGQPMKGTTKWSGRSA